MDFFQKVEEAGAQLDTVAALAKWGVIVLAVGVGVYLIRTVAGLLRPAALFALWLLPVTPGIAAGLSVGVRMLAWAAILGAGIWFVCDNAAMPQEDDMQTKEKCRAPRRPVPIKLVVSGSEEAKEPVRSKEALIIAVATLLGGLVLACFLVYCLRKPKVVEVEVPLPPPPPVVETKEIIKEVFVPAPAPPPPPPKAEVKTEPPPLPPPEPGPYDGVWRVLGRRGALPAFTLKSSGDGFKGTYAPANAAGLFPFVAGQVIDDTLEFSVTDPIGQRVYFAMTFQPDGRAKVAIWRTAEDVLADIQRLAARQGLTPQVRRAAQLALQKELVRAGKRIDIGMFKKAKDPGQDTN